MRTGERWCCPEERKERARKQKEKPDGPSGFFGQICGVEVRASGILEERNGRAGGLSEEGWMIVV